MAAVAVAIKHAAFVIHRDFVEVEQVAIAVLPTAALLPDAGVVLNWIVRCRIDRDPGPPFVIRSCDVRIPHTCESAELVVAAHIRADEAASCTAVAATHRLGQRGVNNAVRGTHVDVTNPANVRTGSLADCDVDMAFGAVVFVVYVTIISGAGAIYPNGRIRAIGL